MCHMQLEVQLEIIKWNVVIIWIGLPGTMADLLKQNDIIIRLSTYFREIIKHWLKGFIITTIITCSDRFLSDCYDHGLTKHAK